MAGSPPSIAEMVVLKPTSSVLAPALPLVCTVFSRWNEKLPSGGWRTGLDMNIARAEADATATTVTPEDCSVFSDGAYSDTCWYGLG
jgi:hypothetical protein